jgi:hypothetical protein
MACSVGAERPPVQDPRVSGLPLPDDLVAVVRVDTATLGSDLGDAPTRQFLLDAVSHGESDDTAHLLERSLAQATLLWVGVPADAAATDAAVLVLRGRFANLGTGAGSGGWTRRDSGIDTIDLLGQDGAGYARVYRLPDDDVVIWTSRAELPRVERSLRGEPGGSVVRPPERGAVSVAARPEGLIERYGSRYPELAERFRGIRRLEAFAEPTSGMWRADLSLDFVSADQASEVSAVIERLKQSLGKSRCAVGVMARAIVVSSFEHTVRMQAVLLPPEVEVVKACVFGNRCCD